MNTSWSYSALTSAVTCLKKYEHQYLLKTKPDYESGDLAFGSALHLALNASLTGGNGEEVFLVYWKSYKHKSLVYGRHKWQDLENLGVQFLAKFEKLHKKKYKLHTAEVRLYAEYKGVKLEGSLDFLGEYDGVMTLADFKTSSMKYEEEKVQTSFQLYLYAYLVIANGLPKPEQLMYVPFLKSVGGIQTSVVLKFDEGDMHKALDEFVAYCTLFDANPKWFPKNYNSCLGYGRKCEMWSKCHANKEIQG